ncbi:TRAF-type zinc finger domain-containing protein 1-like [Centruroides sculpturatus]|uniref:TRAF-type zinc finger domain-containing protein 1-like n=1 Tax=Centruroides sculpturatus TaxID=218467 RepID=UPI000C6D8EAC|nr:TRAF-type zinc finger domain-containing protein 1-like [Centruroides sculpturatus]
MAEASEEMKFCTNCKKDIAAANYLMHTMHCQRNIVLCKKCNESVSRNEIEIHNTEMHSQIVCEKCSKVMERWKLEEHKLLCSKRVVQCSYCELECSLDEMEEHESYCGSRTEICPLCKQYVMIKNRTEHETRNCAETPTRSLVKNENVIADNFGTIFPCEFCGDFFPDVALIEHQATCRSESLSEFDLLPEGGEGYSEEDIPCEFCGDLFPLELLILHQSGCRPDLIHHSQSGGNTPSTKETSNVPSSKNTATNKENSLIPCEFCHNKFLPTALIEHQSFCEIKNAYEESDVLEDSIHRTKSDQNQPEDIPCEFCGEPFPIEFLIDHQATCRSESLSEFDLLPEGGEGYSEEDIPCEFCGDLFPLELLILHQSGCRPDLIHHSQSGGNTPSTKETSNVPSSKNTATNKENSLIPCEFCHNKFLPTALIEHQSFCEIKNAYEESDVLEDSIHRTKSDQNQPEDIPCEFCGEPFPIEFLIDHQAVCNENNLEQILSDELYPPDESEISRIPADEASRQYRKRQESPKLEDILSVKTDNIVKSNDLSKEHNLKTRHSPVDKLVPKTDTSKSEYFKIDKKWLEKPSEMAKRKEFINVDSYFERWDRKHCFTKDTRYMSENRTPNERTYFYRGTTQREYDSHLPRSYNDDRINVSGAHVRNAYREKENRSNEPKIKPSPRNVDTFNYERPTRVKNMSSFNPVFNPVSGSQQKVDERVFEEPTRRPHQLQPLSPDDGNSKNKCTKRKVKSSRED